MKLGIDLTQPSTWRGMIMMGFGLVALCYFALGDVKGGAMVISSGATLAGLIGFGVQDKSA